MLVVKSEKFEHGMILLSGLNQKIENLFESWEINKYYSHSWSFKKFAEVNIQSHPSLLSGFVIYELSEDELNKQMRLTFIHFKTTFRKLKYSRGWMLKIRIFYMKLFAAVPFRGAWRGGTMLRVLVAEIGVSALTRTKFWFQVSQIIQLNKKFIKVIVSQDKFGILWIFFRSPNRRKVQIPSPSWLDCPFYNNPPISQRSDVCQLFASFRFHRWILPLHLAMANLQTEKV